MLLGLIIRFLDRLAGLDGTPDDESDDICRDRMRDRFLELGSGIEDDSTSHFLMAMFPREL